MKRERVIEQMQARTWDMIVIGGGATGLGVGVDAASRGYRTLVLEQRDFAQATSSRSTKLIHGGVRYLQQGNISLVMEALHERGLLLKNAPHLVHHQAFIVPNYEWWEGPFYGIGMKLYDMLAGKLGLGPSRLLSRAEVMERMPTLEPEGLRGGVIYYDGQFDDARLALTLVRTIEDHGGYAANYVRVTGLIKAGGIVEGLTARDEESGLEVRLRTKVVINATGIFVDAIRRMDDLATEPIISPSQGIHLVLDHTFLPGNSAIMVPHTDDGRVLFAVPWHQRVIVGTTDTPIPEPVLEPVPFAGEIEFILTHAARYLTHDPTPQDVLSVFAGIRPLIAARGAGSTAALSRDHHLTISPSGLVTIAGGKWTTYRRMAEDTVNQAAVIAALPRKPCITENLPLHGWTDPSLPDSALSIYGTDAQAIGEMIQKQPALGQHLHPALACQGAQVRWAVDQEMARTVEDVLCRRTRSLLLDARASIQAAPEVARIMAEALGRDGSWQEAQVKAFTALAKNYIVPVT